MQNLERQRSMKTSNRNVVSLVRPLDLGGSGNTNAEDKASRYLHSHCAPTYNCVRM